MENHQFPDLQFIYNAEYTGPQPEIFQGRVSFVKLRHFDNISSKTQEKRSRRGKFWSFFY